MKTSASCSRELLGEVPKGRARLAFSAFRMSTEGNEFVVCCREPTYAIPENRSGYGNTPKGPPALLPARDVAHVGQVVGDALVAIDAGLFR